MIHKKTTRHFAEVKLREPHLREELLLHFPPSINLQAKLVKLLSSANPNYDALMQNAQSDFR